MSRPRLVLIGPPASGKTKIGKEVARLLGEVFVDTDSIITERYGSIPELFATHGEPWFREREREVVHECLANGGVVALGGGAVVTSETRAELARHRVVGLTISPEAVAHRVTESNKRPLLAGGVEAWKALVAARQEWYSTLPERRFDVSHRESTEVAGEIVDWLQGDRDEH